MERLQDQTAGKPTVEQLRLLSAALEAAANGIIITDRAGAIVWVNQAFTRLSGYAFDDVIGRNPRFLKSGKQTQAFYQDLWRTILAGQVWHGEIINRRKDGSLYFEEQTITPLRDEGGTIINFIGIKQDVSDRKRYEVELEQAKKTAEAATQAKSDFLATMSHEIRTPMSSIIGMTELALDSDLTPLQRHYLEVVAVSAEALLEVINDILDFSKIEAGKLELAPREFQLREMLGETLQTLAVRAHKKGLELACRISPDVPDTWVGDAGRLRQIVVNLVGNAVKFTEHGEVVLEVGREPNGEPAASAPGLNRVTPEGGCALHFSVRDTGIGIPREKFGTIFRRFEQADRSTFSKYGGTGLGLAICSQLVAMMGGRIWVESKEGSGSTFHFTAHFDVPARGDQIVQPALGAVDSEASRGSRPQRRLRILLAEDNELNQMVAVSALERYGHTVVVAPSGREALGAVGREDFDLVLMDVQMPDMDGFTATAEIRKRERDLHCGVAGITVGERLPRPVHIPIIAMTAYGSAADRERCLAAGMDAYVSKPVGVRALLEVIEKFTSGMGAHAGESAPRVLAVLDQAAAIEHVDGDLPLLHELARNFGPKSSRLLAEIEAAVTAGDSHKLVMAAHTLNGSAGLLGAWAVVAAAKRLELMGRDGDLGGGAEACAALTAEVARLSAELEELINRR